MQPAAVLNERAFPRNRQRQEQCIEPRIVESLTDVAARRQHQSFFALGYRVELLEGFTLSTRCHPALQDDNVTNKRPQRVSEILDVILSFRQQDRRSPFFQRRDHVIDGVLPHQALNHGDVQPAIWIALTAPNLADVLHCQSQEHGELRRPLFEERLSMHEDKCTAPSRPDE